MRDIDMIKCRTEISKEFRFEAAHRLPFVPAGHKCGRIHGHSFSATVTIAGAVDEKLGWVMDFADLREIVEPFIDEMDHNYLNDIKGLENPTSENVALWLVHKISPLMRNVHLRSITVSETCESSCTVYVES
jgi:6-pyruvoyltetrahydropterin/6-carboxytetrahydropterin synthase